VAASRPPDEFVSKKCHRAADDPLSHSLPSAYNTDRTARRRGDGDHMVNAGEKELS